MPAPVLVAAGRVAQRHLLRRLLKVALWAAPILLAGVVVVVLLLLSIYGSPPNGNQGASGQGCMPVAPAGRMRVAGLSAEQVANAQTIVAIGRQVHAPPQAWVIAVATAMQESGLHNLRHGDRDSLGLFQQRGGWGTPDQRTTPTVAARMFYTGGHAGQKGLLDLHGWQLMPLTRAADAVQHSAFPNAYAKWQDFAETVVRNPVVLAASCYAPVSAQSGPGARVVAAALAQLGTPYSWGGGEINGPSLGVGPGAHTVGFDCSGLTRYAWYQATGLQLPHLASAQAAALKPIPQGQPLQAGDLLFFHHDGDPPGQYYHVGIYDGQGNMIHAPQTGMTVEVVHNYLHNPYYRSHFAIAARPPAGSTAERPTVALGSSR